MPLDRRRVSLQIRAIVVPYRIEHRRRGSETMQVFRDRARALLDQLDDIQPYPDMQDELKRARDEIEADEPLARRRFGEQAVDGRS